MAPASALVPCVLSEYAAKTNADVVEYVTGLQSEILTCEAKRQALADVIKGKE